MTTNQTIDGVPRAALEILLSGRGGLAQAAAAHELRALLDAPACKACNGTRLVSDGALHCSSGGIPFENGPIDCVKDCPACAPAAQPQGVPVKPYGYMFHPDGKKDEEFFIYDAPKERVPDHRGEYWTATPLYTKQPAPLKIGSGVTVENIGFGSEQERKPYLIFDGGGCLTEVNLIDVSLVSKRRAYSISELKEIGVRVEPPAPVAVVLPERSNAVASANVSAKQAYALGWNACLDELKRLNTKE